MYLVHEIAQSYSSTAFSSAIECDFDSEAIKALQFASEVFLTKLNEDTYLWKIHEKWVTLQPEDIKVAVKLRFDKDKMRATIDWKNWTNMILLAVCLVLQKY